MASKSSVKEKDKKKSLFGLSLGKSPPVKMKIAKEKGIDKEVLSPLKENEEEISFEAIKPPYIYVQVVLDKKTSHMTYNVIEPSLTKQEEELLNIIIDTLGVALTYDLQKILDSCHVLSILNLGLFHMYKYQ